LKNEGILKLPVLTITYANGKEFSKHDEELQSIADKLNHRPRKCLNYLTPFTRIFEKQPKTRPISEWKKIKNIFYRRAAERSGFYNVSRETS